MISWLLENELLKKDLTSKDEEQNRIRQRWRKEAEDAIRNLKTKYEDVEVQKQILERQLYESEKEKNRLRNDNDSVIKDYADLQEKIATDTCLRQQNDRKEITPTMEKKLGSEKEMNRILSADLQSSRKENENLAAIITSKEDALKRSQLNVQSIQDDLMKEKNKHSATDKERTSLKGMFSTCSWKTLKYNMYNMRNHCSIKIFDVPNITLILQSVNSQIKNNS